MSKKITSKDLQMAFYYANYQKFEFMAPNVYLQHDCELDIFGLRKGSGYIDEIEIKMVKSDFKADFNKTVMVRGDFVVGESWVPSKHANKHEMLQEGRLPTNRFSFLMPEELAEKVEIPDYAGLYVYTERTDRIKHVKRAKLLHKNKISDSLKYKTARKMAFRYWREIGKI